MSPDKFDGIEIGRITIIRRVTDNDLIDDVWAVDPEGKALPLTEALGMLALAQDTLLHPPAQQP